MRNNRSESRRLNVITISGSGRTGSTLLSLLLSQAEGVFNLGQMRDLWQAYIANASCSCERQLQQCAVYQPVLTRSLEGDTPEALTTLHARMQAFFAAAGRLHSWTDSTALHQLRQEHADFIAQLETVLEAIAEQTGALHLVDASKSPEMALALHLCSNTRTRVLNLARDPRAVACSWHRKKARLKSTLQFCRLWASRQQRLQHWAKNLGDDFMLLRYEDFAARPSESIERVLSWSELPRPSQLFSQPDTANISWQRQHLFPPANENVLARRQTQIPIRTSDSWRKPSLWPLHWLALWAAWPLGWRYIRGRS